MLSFWWIVRRVYAVSLAGRLMACDAMMKMMINSPHFCAFSHGQFMGFFWEDTKLKQRMERWFIFKVRLLRHGKLKSFTELLLPIENIFLFKALLEMQLPPLSHKSSYALTGLLRRTNILNFKTDTKQMFLGLTR